MTAHREQGVVVAAAEQHVVQEPIAKLVERQVVQVGGDLGELGDAVVQAGVAPFYQAVGVEQHRAARAQCHLMVAAMAGLIEAEQPFRRSGQDVDRALRLQE